MSIYHLYMGGDYDKWKDECADEFEEWLAQLAEMSYELDEAEIEKLLGLDDENEKAESDDDKAPACYCNRHDFTHDPCCKYYIWNQKRKSGL